MSKYSVNNNEFLFLVGGNVRKGHQTKPRFLRDALPFENLTVGIRKEPDQWGRDLKVYVTPTKQDKEAHSPKNYVGGGNMIIFASAGQAVPTDEEIAAIIPATDSNEKDNLPY